MTDNRQKVESARYAGLFTKIPAVKGTNRIILTFIPKGMQIGGIISIVCILIAILLIRISGSIPAIADRVAKYAFEFIYGAIMAVMYLIPVIYAIFALLRRFI